VTFVIGGHEYTLTNEDWMYKPQPINKSSLAQKDEHFINPALPIGPELDPSVEQDEEEGIMHAA